MISQIMIAITGVVAVYLSQTKNHRKYACLFGMAGQPFWFYASWQSEQWGILILCFFYLVAWMKGFKLYWIPIQSKSVQDGK